MSRLTTYPVSLAFSPLLPSYHPDLHLIHNVTSPQPFPSNCTLHLSLTLPDALFLDPSSLHDHFASQTVISWSLYPEVIDIERPVSLANAEISNLDLSLKAGDGMLKLDIPLHARYLAPTLSGIKTISLGKNALAAGWVCPPHGRCI